MFLCSRLTDRQTNGASEPNPSIHYKTSFGAISRSALVTCAELLLRMRPIALCPDNLQQEVVWSEAGWDHCTTGTGCVRAAFQMRMNVSLYYLCPYQLVPVAWWHGAELHKCRINVVWCRARARLVMFPVTGTESSFHWSRVSGVENVVSCMNAARQIELTTKFREFSTVFVESWLALSVNHWWVT